MLPVRIISAIAGLTATLAATAVLAQGAGPFRLSRDHAAIQYSTRATHDAIVRLNERIARGEIQLKFEGRPRRYLRSLLEALDIPVSSQTLVFSENSLQGKHISMATPRAIYFNDTVAVGWANGAETLEATALDATQGVHFYSIAQTATVGKPTSAPTAQTATVGKPTSAPTAQTATVGKPTSAPTAQTATVGKPFVRRDNECLQCHGGQETSNVPGLFAMSVLPLSDNKHEYAQGWATDHRTPIEDRWGGWYVTGTQVPARHLGNVAVMHVPKSYVRADVAPKLESAAAAFDTSAYLSPHSDIAALMVLNHQVHMTNLLIRLGWEARVAEYEATGATGARGAIGATGAVRATGAAGATGAVGTTVRELVDYMLFVDEAPLPSPVRGSTSFAQDFAARGPRDSKGRSLRDLDLTRRLLRYPCSYMIYTEAFDALPSTAKDAVYARLWAVLSGTAGGDAYEQMALADRRAIVEILRETKPGLPAYFQVLPN